MYWYLYYKSPFAKDTIFDDCGEMNIPLVVVGPLGSTKTLAFSIVTNNMKGRRANLAPYTSFHSAHVFRYDPNLVKSIKNVSLFF